MMTHAILNISAYRFVQLTDVPALQRQIQAQAAAQNLLGTVLLACEGINLFLAGAAPGISAFLDWLQKDTRFHKLEANASWSAQAPFTKLCVKAKPEIIRMNHPTIAPAQARAPAVSAPTLARWLDQGHDDTGRSVITLDTRNAFEVAQGQFEGAQHWNLQKFSDFPQAAQAHGHHLRGKTVVSYCTGGIRCEKAALYLQSIGAENVLQLEGGILKYFEETDGRHFNGRCFVFDERIAVDAQLQAQAPPAARNNSDTL
jgi:UPF0176 protein